MAFAAKANPLKKVAAPGHGNHKSQRKDRSFCTHCNFHSHAIKRCYKIHGYPPGYKPCPRNLPQATVNHNVAVNQVTDQSIAQDNGNKEHGSKGDFLQNLNSAQYQQLINFLSSHMSVLAINTDQQSSWSTSHSAGHQSQDDDW